MKYIIDTFSPQVFLNKDIRIPDQYKDEFLQEETRLNLERIRVIATILIVINTVMVFVDIFLFYDWWGKTPNYRNLFYAHGYILIFLTYYRHLLCMREKNFGFEELVTSKLRESRMLSMIFIMVMLFWCTFITINDQQINGQITVYIICMFSLASFIVLEYKTALFIYTFIHILFIWGIVAMKGETQYISGNIINGTVAIVLAFSISRYKHRLLVKDFINRKEIEEKTLLLNSSQVILEKAIEERTEELKKANKMLIKEITRRHKAEIKAIKGKLLYEKKAKELNEAIEYEKIRTAFFANLSHELKTPLNVIFSAQQTLDYLLKSPLEEKGQIKMQKYSRITKQNCYRLVRLINNLIDITKIDAGCFDVQLNNHNFIKIVEDITLSVAAYIEGKGIELVFDTEIEEKIIACDPDKIERIVLNLLSNAVKFTPQGGRIFVNIYLENSYILLNVRDTGIGIPEEMKEKVLERFVQVDKSMKRNREGSGIGLALVKQLVEMHEGSIKIVNGEENGTEFIVAFPDIKISKKSSSDAFAAEKSQESKIERINVEFSDIYL